MQACGLGVLKSHLFMEDLILTKFILLKILVQAHLILLLHMIHWFCPVFPLIFLMELVVEEVLH
jgi:hypothetical protein